MNLYAVVGQPVEHSLSPRIHRLFAEQMGEVIEYRCLPMDDFVAGVRGFFHDPRAHGLNITLPFKTEALALANVASERAQRVRAANLLRREPDGSLFADNTDGVGLVADLERLGVPLQGRSVLLLGAGGAAQGVLGALCDAGVARLYIGNRTAQRALALAAHWGLEGGDLDNLAGGWDLVLNATSSGHQGTAVALDPACVRGAWCYDLSYGRAAEPFRDWARSAPCLGFSDGLGMLVEQAAESWLLWRGRRPETASVLGKLMVEQH